MQKHSTICKIFPKPLHDNLSYDVEGLWSITHPDEAELISINIIKILELQNMPKNHILDMTAGCGGNTISFCNYFKDVTAVENNEIRFKLLQQNLNCYNYNNYKLINGDSIQCIDNIYDVFFIDPPWGGPNYKYEKSTNFGINNMSLNEVTKILRSKDKIVIWKLPFNYNLNEFDKFNYEIHHIKNYLILIIE
jgi:16S rRNA G966 N2-methylase RsmD